MDEKAAEAPSAWGCPVPGCGKHFLELWRLRDHHRAPRGRCGRGHGVELLHCPRCFEVLPKQKEGRHRCKGPPPSGPAAAAAAAAAAAEADKIVEVEAAEAAAAAAAATAAAAVAAEHGGRSRRVAAGKRVRWTLPDSDEDETHVDGGLTSEDENDAPKKRRTAVAAALAAAAAQESPVRQALAAPALLSTPRGTAAAQLLAGLRASGPLALPLGQAAPPTLLALPAGGTAALSTELPGQLAGRAALQGTSWWQAAVRPKLVQQRVAASTAALSGVAASAPAKIAGAGPGTASLAAPELQPLVPALPSALVSPVLAAAPLSQALAPPLMHALEQPAGLAVAESLGELLLLLKTVVSAEDAEAFVGLVFEDQARIVEAQGGASADALLQALAHNLPARCAAVRQLTQAKAHAQLAEQVTGAVRLNCLSKLVSTLNAAAGEQAQQQKRQAQGFQNVRTRAA